MDVQTIWDDSYPRAGVVTPREPPIISENTVLGYGCQPPSYNNAYYDAVLLFNEIDFIDNYQYQSVERYFFVSMELYKIVNMYTRPPEFTKKLFGGPHIFMATGVTKLIDYVNYVEFLYKGELLYLPRTEADRYKKNMLDWRQFFRVLGKAASEISETVAGLDFIRDNYDWSGDGGNVGAVLGDSEPEWWRERRDEPHTTKSIKRSIVCGHPLEWDKELYTEGGRVRREIIRPYGAGVTIGEQNDFIARVNVVDIWEELSGKKIDGLNMEENNFWYAHPMYFINHLEGSDLLDRSFNPYENRTIARYWKDGRRVLEVKDVVVKDNPGFAPRFEPRDGQTAYEGDIFKHGDYSYAVPTGIFNQQYYSGARGIYPHEGVDFRGNECITPIYALVYANVIHINISQTTGYGRYVLLQSETNSEYFYMLGHISHVAKGISIGTVVGPGDIVAYVGNTGNSSAAHLHLHFMKAPNRNEILGREGVIRTHYYAYNPFNHLERYERPGRR